MLLCFRCEVPFKVAKPTGESQKESYEEEVSRGVIGVRVGVSSSDIFENQCNFIQKQ